MKNFIQKGSVITVTAPVATKSGDLVVVGKLAGVAANDALISTEVEIVTHGVFELPLTGASQGDPVYVDHDDGTLSLADTDNFRIGVAIAASGTSTTRIRLDGILA